jgi:asparagine synthase (glutamine-hydrolysing)
MCGIAGFITKNINIDYENILKNMGTAIEKRGPDDYGIWFDEKMGIGLSHRRLSILDLSPLGHQPMFSPNKRYTIVFNGEIYNHIDLRNFLKDEFGEIIWKSQSDTETILQLIDKYGVLEAVKKLNGMFSMAIWDSIEKTIYLTRDRIGEKPLYYGWHNNTFLFASEIKSFYHHPDFTKQIDKVALNLYFKYNYVPYPYSIYKDIKKLKPGSILKLDITSLETNFITYWDFHDVIKSSKFRNEKVETLDNYSIQLEKLLTRSISNQMISDVPLGAFLSGGIDSSLIVAIMQSISKIPVKTFTIGFNEEEFNEALFAKKISNYLNTDHTELYLNSNDAISIIPELPTIYDEPFSDSSQIPTYLVASLAKKHVSVCLSGDGGDELFGGYNRYSQSLKFKNSIILKNLTKIFLNLSPRQIDKIYKIFKPLLPRNLQSSNPSNHLVKIANILNSSTNWEIYEKLILTSQNKIVLNSNNNLSFSNIKKYFESLSDNFTFQERMMYTDSVTYLTDDILCKVDRAAMGVSLETRVPFLDHKVASYAWTLPQNLKLRNGEGKWILKQLLYKHIPKNLMERPKTGFGLPLDIWLRTSLKNFTDDLLDKSLIKNSEILNSYEIANIWKNHKNGKQNSQFEIWNILMFTMWQDEWM